MLARLFLTAEELKIPEEWREALIKVLDAMERGEFIHTQEADIEWLPRDDGDPRLFLGRFNMAFWRDSAKCGTVCCIGGAAECLGGVNFDEEASPRMLRWLFHPSMHGDEVVDVDYESITVEQAKEALRLYLSSGSPQWGSVLNPEAT